MNSKILYVCVLLAGLLGCNASYAGKTSATDEHQGFVGKPHAPVEMKYVSPNKVTVAKKLGIHVTLVTAGDVEALDVAVRFDEGLQAVSEPRLHFGPSAKKSGNQFEIECVPQRNGLFYVHLQATLSLNGQQQTRSFTIPVNVGDVDVRKAMKSSGAVTQDASGEAIISMPAQETRKPAK